MNAKSFFLKTLPESSDQAKTLWDFLENNKLSKSQLIHDLIISYDLQQNRFHNEFLYQHLIHCYMNCMDYFMDPIFGLAGLFHDIGKVSTRAFSEKTKDYTFYRHEYVGSKLVRSWMLQEGFSNFNTDRVCNAIAHSGYRIFDNTTDKSIKRWLRKIGKQTWADIRILRLCDRMANKANKDKPVIYKKYIEDDIRINNLAEKIFI